MRIDRLELQNFKKFESLTLDLHPRFTLLVGDNGSGKTSVLDALAVSLGVWFEVKPEELPDSNLRKSRRTIQDRLEKEGWTDVRLEPLQKGDRTQFEKRLPVQVKAEGTIIDENGIERSASWNHQIRTGGLKATSDADAALDMIRRIYKKDQTEKEKSRVLCPILAYYGAGRASPPSNRRSPDKTKSNGLPMRWAAFYDCLNDRIRFEDLRSWFRRETTAAGNRGGSMRPGFEAVKKAVLGCVPDADNLWFDPDLEQVVLSIEGNAQPLDNLSAGQRMMLAMVADIAIKAVTQNAFLVPPNTLGSEDEPLPRVLRQTPGVVLIDELDVHLHPKWQRSVAKNLKDTFPALQFVCTSHSPQIIGELKPEEIRSLEGNTATIPPRSYGIDSSRILEELMGAESRTHEVREKLDQLAITIDNENFDAAREELDQLEEKVGENDPEVTRARTLMAFLEE